MTSGRPLRADAARNRALLLDSAREAFARAGVTASLDDVAKAAGVGAGTLYRHFPNRDALVLTVIDEGLMDLHRLGTTLADAPDPLAALREWLAAYIAQAGMFDGLAKTLATAPTESSPACRMSREAGAALVARAADAGAIRRGVGIAEILDLGAAIAWVGEQPGRDEAELGRLLDIVVAGIRAA
ncbi:TetR family transcriptional regulator [Mycolicibacterium litorale]|uniref:TetR family transcriptional regulator n=1 Tax=Mycolicibacterium litorale TaxID=758802 RepID=A0A6S6PD92_9MYCO|nr:TetR family transcriptional regulator [Mycolicibacterium litorale]BCI56062.1 TetR family transcriptional regulator [Mycolicibacterium litorale]